jgi:cytochrome c oxidase accessory protein FixG
MSSTPQKKQPDLVSVTTINKDGSRYFLQPSNVSGRFTRWRRTAGIILLAVYAVLPWIKINGFPAVFLDVATRRFHFFGLTLAAQDLWILFFLIVGMGFTLFVVTAILGRLWCGYACPYTVFLDQLYRPIERWIEGDGPARRKMDDAPWKAPKILRRGTKWVLYALISTAIAHVFLAYFVSIPELWDMMHRSPLENARSFGIVAFLSVALYFCFTWFREQFCVIMCPYGRLQSALTDDDTIIIGYDSGRGEPRGKKTDPEAGDCIDCRRCVTVCPTGIDIRNGLQLECIGCAACIDACDAVMEKVDRPRGLVRYDSMKGLAGQPHRFLRPRIAIYAAIVLVGVGLFGVTATRNARPINAQLVLMRGNPYLVNDQAILNRFRLNLINKRNQPVTFAVSLVDPPAGVGMSGLDETITFAAGKEDDLSVVFLWERMNYEGSADITVRVHAEPGNTEVLQTIRFLGPNPALLDGQ